MIDKSVKVIITLERYNELIANPPSKISTIDKNEGFLHCIFFFEDLKKPSVKSPEAPKWLTEDIKERLRHLTGAAL